MIGRFFGINQRGWGTSFKEVLGNIMPFINLFDSLSGLLNQTDKSSPRMLDVDCSNSVIGKKKKKRKRKRKYCSIFFRDLCSSVCAGVQQADLHAAEQVPRQPEGVLQD